MGTKIVLEMITRFLCVTQWLHFCMCYTITDECLHSYRRSNVYGDARFYFAQI